jgi:predicted nucleic acid-binding protein
MTSFFPDLNVWLALSVASHSHSAAAWRWMNPPAVSDQAKQASKWVGDCYLLAYAKQTQAALVTFDRALQAQAKKQGHLAIMPDENAPPRKID